MTNESHGKDSSFHSIPSEVRGPENCKSNSPEYRIVDDVPGLTDSQIVPTANMNTTLEHPVAPPLVRYKQEYRNDTTNAVVHVEVSEEPFGEPSSASSAFDIVTTFNTPDNSTWNSESKGKPQLISAFGEKSIRIYSRSIINALQIVVDYDSTQTLFGDSIIVQEPFAILVHYYDQLSEYRRKFDPCHGHRELCSYTKDAYLHLGLLIDYLDAHVMPDVREEEARHKMGVATFDMLWLLWKPGCQVVANGARGQFDPVSKRWDGFILHSAHCRKEDGQLACYDLILWAMEYNGNNLQSHEVGVAVFPFSGQRYIRDLPDAVPAQYWENPDDPNYTVEYLKSRGRKYFSLLQKQCAYYTGETLQHPFLRVKGLYFSLSVANSC